MALSLCTGTILFGAVTIRLAVPVYCLALVLALLWVAKLFFAETLFWKKSPMHWPVIVFFAYAVIRYFTSPIEYDARGELFQIGLCVFIYFLSAFNFNRPADRNVLFMCLLMLGLGESAYGLWQFATRSPTVLIWERPDQYFHRAGGTYICPNHLGGFLEMVLGLIIARLAIHRTTRGPVQQSVLHKIFVVYAAVVLVAALLATLSRASWFSLTVGLVMLLFWGSWRWQSLRPRLVVAGIGLALIALLAFKIERVRGYIQTTFSGEKPGQTMSFKDPTLGSRTKLWAATVSMIRDHPGFGTGGGSWEWIYPKYRPKKVPANPEFAHNDYLNLLSDYGAVGFVIMLAVIVAFYRHAALLAKPDNPSEARAFAVGTGIAVTAILMHSWFDFNLHILANALLLTTLMGFTVAMEDPQHKFPRVQLSQRARYSLAVGLVLLCALAVNFVRPTALAYHYTSKANNYKSHGYPDEALDYYQRAIRLDPKYPQPHAKIGDIYRTRGEWRAGAGREQERRQLAEKAIAAYQRALSLNPYDSEALLRQGRAFEMAGNDDQALLNYQRASVLDPESPVVYQYLGRYYRLRGDDKNAEQAYQKSAERDWGYDDPVSWINLEELKQRP